MGTLMVGVILIGAGIIFIIMGRNKKKRCTEAVPGRIIDVLKERNYTDEGSNWHYYPVYEYWTGYQTVRKKGNDYSGSKRKYRVGQTVMIRFNPQDPGEFTVGGKTADTTIGVMLIVLGLIVVIAILANGLR